MTDTRTSEGKKLRALDLFCGAGGAGKGLACAGFEVVGVDIKPQPNYPNTFIQADAVAFPVDGFDFVWASPPCQAYTSMRVMANAGQHPELIEPVRSKLMAWGGPFVIENVPQAPLEVGPPQLFSPLSGVVLCGSMFDLRTAEYELRRHRLFESNVWLPQPACQHDATKEVIGFYGDHARRRTRVNGHHARGLDISKNAEKMALVRDLMGIDWMTWTEAKEAIPPAYGEWIGRQILRTFFGRDDTEQRISARPILSNT